MDEPTNNLDTNPAGDERSAEKLRQLFHRHQPRRILAFEGDSRVERDSRAIIPITKKTCKTRLRTDSYQQHFIIRYHQMIKT